MSQRALPWSGREIRSIRAALLDFFDEHRRPLPWRSGEPDPWGVLVSEVMSQQTRIETVVPYYLRWMERFPDPGALAEAEEEEVLALWEGLGYYSRARHLHRAAREIEERYGGSVPADPGELRTLPGVGPYTAGAVASIAHGVPAPAVDGNVRRVLSRLLDEPRPTPARLEAWAGALVDPGRPGDSNQALMELGATVCTPRSPVCDRCPFEAHCGAREEGTVLERPEARSRRAVPELEEGVLVPVRSGEDGIRLFMRRRPPNGLLAGMWEFPGAEGEPGESPVEAAARLARDLGVVPRGAPRPLSVVRHVFSHRIVRYHPFVQPCDGAGTHPARDAVEGGRWLGPDRIAELPMPVAQRTILKAAREFLEGIGAVRESRLR